MTNSVLITGASGLIGRRLTTLLLQKGCRVSHLGRSERPGPIPSFVWDPERGTVDKEAVAGVDTVIHLAGSSIADRRWTAKRKKVILDSRIQSTSLLHELLKTNRHSVKTVVAASAIGLYGFGSEEVVLNELSPPGSDFLSTVVFNWEHEISRLETPGLRVVKIRIGIVLSSDGGALKELVRPIYWGVGAALGRGRQVVSWIHLDDLCGIFMMAILNEGMRGAYNGTAPKPATNRQLTESIAMTLGRRILLPNIPAALMHLLLGEMADLVLFGGNVSCKKILELGFKHEYPELSGALKNLLIK